MVLQINKKGVFPPDKRLTFDSSAYMIASDYNASIIDLCVALRSISPLPDLAGKTSPKATKKASYKFLCGHRTYKFRFLASSRDSWVALLNKLIIYIDLVFRCTRSEINALIFLQIELLIRVCSANWKAENPRCAEYARLEAYQNSPTET